MIFVVYAVFVKRFTYLSYVLMNIREICSFEQPYPNTTIHECLHVN